MNFQGPLVPLFLVLTVILLALIYTIRVLRTRRVTLTEYVEENNISIAPRVTPSVPFLGSMEYFAAPYDFLKSNAKKHGEIYSFELLRQEVFFFGNNKRS